MTEDEEVGVCTECRSDQPDQYMIRNPFFQQGGNVPCKFCNTPDAPIWMSDLSFKPIGEISTGDFVVGIQKDGKSIQVGESTKRNSTGYKSRLVEAEVLKVTRHEAEIVKVTTASGRELKCTPNHLWWSGKKNITAKNPWVNPAVGVQLRNMVDPYLALDQSQLFDAGYLAGIYDGEGSSVRIAQSEIANPEVCARIEQALKSLDIKFTRTVGHNGPGMVDYTIIGGTRGYMEFLHKVGPEKTSKLRSLIFSAQFTATPDEIVDVEPGGMSEVVDLTTTTGTYVAWGFGSSNCGGVTMIVKRSVRDNALKQSNRERGLN